MVNMCPADICVCACMCVCLRQKVFSIQEKKIDVETSQATTWVEIEEKEDKEEEEKKEGKEEEEEEEK